jgi:exodeoxyribonuclease V beta subunit
MIKEKKSPSMSFQPYLAYSASAGSGKTFALSVRYLSLLFMGESPATILAATFTNKAAAEMRQRVIKYLRTLQYDTVFLQEISAQTGLSPDALIEKQPEVLAQFLASPSHIVTLDSFFVSILRAASLELGLEPDFVTKEESEEMLEMLFLEEVDHDGRLGSLVRLAMDIEDKRFAKIFGLMQDFYRLDPLLPSVSYGIPDIAAIEVRIEACRQEIYALLVKAGVSQRALNNFAPVDAKTLSAKTVFKYDSLADHRDYKKYIQTDARIDILFVQLKEMLSAWMEAKERIVLYNLFTLYDHYKNARISHAKHAGVLTFDDLTYFTYRLLYESISKEFLYFKLDAKFRHILLDEFQDTSTLQFLLLKPLIDEIFSGQGQSELRSFFYVGDTKQSLYRFRGGVEELFDAVAKRYGIEVAQMDTNYRSSRNVVGQVNRWFDGVMPGFVPQKAHEGAPEGYVEVTEVAEAEELIASAVEEVRRLLALGISVDEIALLVHTNKDGQKLQEACEAEGIATLLKTSSSLKYLPKIAALSAMLSYLFYGERIDAEAMLSYTGKRLEEVDLGWFSTFMAPVEVIDRLVREFGYFDEDRNLLRLMAFAAMYEDIPTFLEAFATSRIPVAQGSVHGAQIMTIHGSKGLEFGHVILLDKLTRPNSDRSPLLYHYNDDLAVERVFYRMKGREYLDRLYASVIEERKTAEAKDGLNRLYVALTRAVEGMTVIKKEEGSVFDVIGMQAGMCGEKRAHLHASSGQVRQEDGKKVQLSRYGTQELPDTDSTDETEEEIDHEAVLFGTALHYALEMMAQFDRKSLQTAIIAMKSRYGQKLASAQIDDITTRLEALIENDEVMALFEDAKVYKERAFSYHGELRQVDLLLEYPERYLVIDYKSSKKGMLKHKAQVSAYVEAIGALTGKQTQGMILYLEKEGIDPIFLD